MRKDLKGSKEWLMELESVGLSEKRQKFSQIPPMLDSVLDFVYAYKDLSDCFNRVSSSLRQAWSSENL